MKLVNETPWQARLFFGNVEEDVNLAWIIARATFRLEHRTTLVPASEPWPIFVKPVRTRHGVFPGDDVANRFGCDVIVAGNATSSKPVPSLEARLRAGSLSNSICVFGDRFWRKAGSTLVPTDPQPFTVMPVDWTRALGGSLMQDGMAVPDPINPEGRGAYMSEQEALNRPLPNLEDPGACIRKWNDRPLPVAWAPIANSPVWQMASWVTDRARQGNAPVTHAEIAARSQECFVCAAPPRNVATRLGGGDPVDIALGEARASFFIPHPKLAVHASFGTDRVHHPLEYSGVWVLLDPQLVVFTLRASFRYALRPGETRVAVLHAFDGP